MNTAQKIYGILSRSERRNASVILFLMFVAMALETLGIGLVVPAIAILLQEDVVASYPILRPAVEMLGTPSPSELVVYGISALVGVYLFKTVFLTFMLWNQNRFAFGVQANLSERLFSTYLRQPYTFHLQRNSAELMRNILTEVNLFNTNGLLSSMLILAESLVLLGIAGLLLIVEPVGALIVTTVLGGSTFLYYRSIRSHVERWGTDRHLRQGLRIQHLEQGLGAVDETSETK